MLHTFINKLTTDNHSASKCEVVQNKIKGFSYVKFDNIKGYSNVKCDINGI